MSENDKECANITVHEGKPIDVLHTSLKNRTFTNSTHSNNRKTSPPSSQLPNTHERFITGRCTGSSVKYSFRRKTPLPPPHLPNTQDRYITSRGTRNATSSVSEQDMIEFSLAVAWELQSQPLPAQKSQAARHIYHSTSPNCDSKRPAPSSSLWNWSRPASGALKNTTWELSLLCCAVPRPDKRKPVLWTEVTPLILFVSLIFCT